MPGAERGGLAQRGWERLPANRIGLERVDRFELAHARGRHATEIGRLRIQTAVDSAAHLAEHPTGLEAEPACLRADRAQRRADLGTGSDRDDPASAAPAQPRVDA